MFSKTMNESTRRAIRVRLEVILDEKEKSYTHWQEMIKPKMNKSRIKMVEREFRKTIQAMKIVIHSLTPFFERITDVPTFVIRKDKKE